MRLHAYISNNNNKLTNLFGSKFVDERNSEKC